MLRLFARIRRARYRARLRSLRRRHLVAGTLARYQSTLDDLHEWSEDLSNFDPPPPLPCTDVSARWCPVHGFCTCPGELVPPLFMGDIDCPLHGKGSEHFELVGLK